MKQFIILATLLSIDLAGMGQGPAIKDQQGDTIRLGSLEATIRLADQNNLTQAIYRQQVQQAALNYKAAKSIFYPTVSTGLNATDNLSLPVTPVPGGIFGTPGKTTYVRFGQPYVYDAGLNLGMDLINWASVLQMKIAAKNADLSRLQESAFRQSLKEQVARLYYSVLIAKSSLRINRRDRLLADSVLTLSRQKLANGATDLLSVNEAVINSNTIEQNQQQSQQLLDQGIENLKILLGEMPTTELVVTEELDPGTPGAASPGSLAIDKNLVVYRQQQMVADLQRWQQKAAFYPKVSLSGFLGDQQFRDQFGMSFNSNAWSSYQYIELSVTVPLFSGFSNRNKYKSSVVQEMIAELQWESAVQQSEINDRLLWKNYADYLAMVRSSAGSFELYGQNLGLDEQKYREGLISLDVYMKAFQDYLSAENVYLNDLSQLLSVKSTFISRQ
jgi:outer membrane protein